MSERVGPAKVMDRKAVERNVLGVFTALRRRFAKLG
jgi:hypothetical protein